MCVAGGLEEAFCRGIDAMMSGSNQTRSYTRIINKWGCVIPCLHTFQVVLADDGDVEGFVHSWTTLPNDA